MGEGVDAVDRLGVTGMGDGGDLLRGAADAADRGQNPDLVARADAAVRAAVAEEAGRLRIAERLRRRRLVRIALDALKQGGEIVVWTWAPSATSAVRRPMGQPNLWTV